MKTNKMACMTSFLYDQSVGRDDTVYKTYKAIMMGYMDQCQLSGVDLFDMVNTTGVGGWSDRGIRI